MQILLSFLNDSYTLTVNFDLPHTCGHVDLAPSGGIAVFMSSHFLRRPP